MATEVVAMVIGFRLCASPQEEEDGTGPAEMHIQSAASSNTQDCAHLTQHLICAGDHDGADY